MSRLFLSPPHLSGGEMDLVQNAFASNWVSPLGPYVDAFEREFSRTTQTPYALALSSGTAALHLAVKLVGAQAGDEVLCSTLTFAASANPVAYEGAQPVFVDSEGATWNMDPALLADELKACASRGRLPKAVIVVDLYGQSADWRPIQAACAEYSVPIIEDAAEALGATYKGRPVGGFGKFGVFSFNGNKIITTSGGGMLVSHDADAIKKARFLATQAREPAPHYEHREIGYNYRLSNVLAAIGCAQLSVLEDRISARRRNFDYYRKALGDLPGIEFMPEAPNGRSTRWLTCLTINPAEFGATRDDVRLALEKENIEARPVWKPMHLQPVFAGCRSVGGKVAEHLFRYGLCLPSGSSLTTDDLERVSGIVRSCCRHVSGVS